MPSVSPKQAHLMAAVAHGWRPAGAHLPSLAVAREFHDADKKAGKWEHASRQSSDHNNKYRTTP